MYDIHATKTQHLAVSSADNLANIITMVALSIQQPWDSVGTQMQDVKKYGCGSKFLWGNKRNTYKHVQKHKGKIYGQYRAILNSSKDTDTKALKLMLLFMSIPGLGAVKAGFVCQLAAGLVGCIDLHNIRLYGINENMLKISNKIKSKELYAAKVSKYISVCHNIGTEKLWNTWCEHVAKQPNKFNSAAEVSAAHVEYLLV